MLKHQIQYNRCIALDTTTEDYKFRQTEREHEDTIEKLRESKYIAAEKDAIICCKSHAEETKNPFVMEKYLEILKYSLHTQIFGKNEKRYNKYIKQTQKELLSIYEKDPNPQVEFALAKNLVYFSTKDKDKSLGTKMLKSLSERPLSKILEEYQLKGKETLKGKNQDENDYEDAELNDNN